jgi:transcriptional regulator with XRE-family HTH domain
LPALSEAAVRTLQGRYLIRYHEAVESLDTLVRDARLAAGLSQRALAKRAGTSQPAVARYERGVATPSWETLQRLVAACGQRLRLSTEVAADPHDVELAARLLELTPLQRLRALGRYAHLRELASEQR